MTAISDRRARVTRKLDAAADALRKTNPQLSKAQAITQVIEEDPSWMDDFDRVTRLDAQDVVDEQYRNQRT